MNEALLSSKRHDWRTPKAFFESVTQEFGPLDTDAAASAENALCPHFWDEQADALRQDWNGKHIWCNPPYGRTIKKWVAKAYSTIGTGGGSGYAHPVSD
jgi:phage N-6-adenine-methyltransferase